MRDSVVFIDTEYIKPHNHVWFILEMKLKRLDYLKKVILPGVGDEDGTVQYHCGMVNGQ